MKLQVVSGCLIALLGSNIAAAVPPPPSPEKYVASWRAIEALTPYLGEWIGTETLHFKVGEKDSTSDRPVFWRLTRLAGKDVILLEHGTAKSAGFTGFTEFTDILTFDPIASSYEMYLPGYRLFTDNDRTSELEPVSTASDGRLSWSAMRNDGGKLRTTIWLESGIWHERVEKVAPDGSASLQSEAALTKKPG